MTTTVQIPYAGDLLHGEVAVPNPAHGVVIFAHGSGSSRHSPRNRYVAGELYAAGFATVLADLLTPAEERADAVTGSHRFNIDLLTRRVAALTDWAADHEPLMGLRIGLFGASTGSAAALVAAAVRPDQVRTVVSRGGRPDLAGEFLPLVRQPVLLIVGSRDEVVLDLNRGAMTQLSGPAELEIVPGASHLFEEPGALQEVARLAVGWFVQHLIRQEE